MLRTRHSLGRPSVSLGDAFDLIDRVEDNSLDLIITSPPYWGLRSYGLKHDEAISEKWRIAGRDPGDPPEYEWYRKNGGVLGLEPYPEWYVAHVVEFFVRAAPKLGPSGSLWLNLGDTYFARWSSIRDQGRQGISTGRSRRRTPSGGYLQDKQLLLVPARVAIAMQDEGWILRNDLIWAKPNPLPGGARDRLRSSHEHLFHFVKRPTGGRRRASYYYDREAVEDGALDVISVATARHQDHSATFPEDLIEPRIRSCCPPRGTVLDPFCGTGTALALAVATGRTGIGFEANADYARIAHRRVREALKRGIDYGTGRDGTNPR